MSQNDEAAQEEINRLKSQLDAADIENEELLQKIGEKDQVIKSLQWENRQLICEA